MMARRKTATNSLPPLPNDAYMEQSMSGINSRLSCACKQDVYPPYLAKRYAGLRGYGGFCVSTYFLPPPALTRVGARELARCKAILGVAR